MTYHSFRHEGAPQAPVFLALHGTGGDEYLFVDLIQTFAPNAGIVAPRGDVSEFGANRFFRRTAEGVYDMDDLELRTRNMLDFVALVRADYPNRPLYAFGFSNGANILASMLFQRPGLFDRAALLHPFIPWKPAAQPALKGLPIFISAGCNDPICPLPQSLALIDWFTHQGAAVESLIEPGGHQITQNELNGLFGFLLHPQSAGELSQ